jgi:hypothetical protein
MFVGRLRTLVGGILWPKEIMERHRPIHPLDHEGDRLVEQCNLYCQHSLGTFPGVRERKFTLKRLRPKLTTLELGAAKDAIGRGTGEHREHNLVTLFVLRPQVLVVPHGVCGVADRLGLEAPGVLMVPVDLAHTEGG